MGACSRVVEQAPEAKACVNNHVYVHADDALLAHRFAEVGGRVFWAEPHPLAGLGAIGLNGVQRRMVRQCIGEPVHVEPYDPDASGVPDATVICAEVLHFNDARSQPVKIQADAVTRRLVLVLAGQVLSTSQEVLIEHEGRKFRVLVTALFAAEAEGEVPRAFVRVDTTFVYAGARTGCGDVRRNPVEVVEGDGVAVGSRSSTRHRQLFKTAGQVTFELLGIGGLDQQFEAIFRRAFASRVFPPALVQRLGIKHVKGILLHGPPGTGKTLIARQIGKMLNGREPKVVNGPEVLGKYVGESEENVRKLFADADAEYRERGDDSELHIIIFDEIDAICKARGSVRDGTGVHDTVVNQLLTKIDGVNALNNVLIIGMTNRKDMLDEALTRAGRLEVHVEVGLPDERGRLQILQIHTSKMAANSFLGQGVDLAALAAATCNFSGAEIEGLVKSAVAYALRRNVDFDDLRKPIDEDLIKVTPDDFAAALQEVRPAFGVTADSLHAFLVHAFLPDCDPALTRVVQALDALVQQVQGCARTPLLSCLLDGPAGSGKSALAAKAGLGSGFPFVKVVSQERMVGLSEQAKCAVIAKVFEDAYKSPLSMIVLDDLERLLEYVGVGPRFSNAVLQALLVLVKRAPPPGRRLLVVGTTGLPGEVARALGLAGAFDVPITVPALQLDGVVRVLRRIDVFELRTLPAVIEELVGALGDQVPIKKLLLWAEMARQGNHPNLLLKRS
jgi:vesicle-fusing ATPase